MLRKVFGRFARRWAWVETALRVQERFGEVHGGYLAAAITFASFTSLFPLILVATAVLGWLSFRDANVAGEIIGRLGLPSSGDASRAIVEAVETAENSRRIAGPIGALGLVWLVGSAALFVVSFGLTAALNYVPAFAPVAVVVGTVMGVGLWLWTMHSLTNVDVPWRAHLPGAIVAALGFEVLKAIGSVYVPRAVGSSSALYGSLGVVFAILAWLFFFGRLAVYAATLNVVRWEEQHGTVTVEIELPKHPERVTVEATRSGEAKTPTPT